ncbi:MAG TPA: helix-turn-helix domain-containing protein [Rhodocyclaceae bacterium]|nr:helix-turn-helix domain-containing protein [Rhodocyclaceae bacterium]
MSGTVNLHVGSIEEMGKRFAHAWHRLERGEEIDEAHLTFFDFETMVATLSPKRLALLRHVHQHPAATVAELAKSLRRDYKRVHEDVTALEHAGLLLRDKNGIRAPYATVRAIVSLEG